MSPFKEEWTNCISVMLYFTNKGFFRYQFMMPKLKKKNYNQKRRSDKLRKQKPASIFFSTSYT